MDYLLIFASVFCNFLMLSGGHQNLPPGVNPAHYQQAAHQMPQMQQVPQQHMPQHVPMQQVPVQQQQMNVQQQQMMQQQQMQMQQQQQMQMQQQQMQMQQQQQQQQHHAHHGPPQVLNVANIQQEKQHIAEHLSVPMDTSKMTEQELQFHYFKMHDADNNNKLDGCELIKSLIHWHAEQGQADQTGQKPPEKLFTDAELVSLIDPILSLDDSNRDGFIDYPEFVRAQQKAAASGAPQ